MSGQRSAERLEALGCVLGGGLSYSWFDVRELNEQAVTAVVATDPAENGGDQFTRVHQVTAQDVARGLRMYGQWLRGEREGYPGEWRYAAEGAVRAGRIRHVDQFDPAIHARADRDAYGWQVVRFDRTNGQDGDYDANTADSVMQFAILGHCIYS